MSEINDAAVEAAARVLCPRAFAPPYRPGPRFYDAATGRVAVDREQERGRARAALTAALPHLTPEPRVITTAEEMEALPVGIVVRSDAGTIACRYDERRGVVFGYARPFPWGDLALPATVLHTPKEDR